MTAQIAQFVVHPRSYGDVLWASCFAYGRSKISCLENNSYHGRCTLHPTTAVPPVFALKQFLQNFKSVQSITNITGKSLLGFVRSGSSYYL
jgi:hypothetical protein